MHINIVRLKAVANILSTIEDEFVFVGGATVSLYATNPELASEVRPTIKHQIIYKNILRMNLVDCLPLANLKKDCILIYREVTGTTM